MRRSLFIAAVLAGVAVVAAPAASAPEQGPKRGGTIVVALPSPEPACLNVLDERCHPGTSLIEIASAVFAAAFELGPDLSPRPRLAEVAYTKSRPFTLTYRIRPEARWSDGVPVTARDFVFTLRAIRSSNLSFERQAHSHVRSARVVDAKTLRVVLRPRYAGWRQLFGYVLPEHALRGQDLTRIWTDGINNPKTGAPIGSGPFLVGDFARGRQLTLVRNPRYWDLQPAYVDRLVVRFGGTPKERADGLRSGALDLALGIGIGDEYLALRGEPGLRLSASPQLAFEHLELRVGPGGHQALRKKLVRQALAYGIDRVALVRQVYSGVVSNPAPLESMVLPAQSAFYERSWSGYRRRPELARTLLQQAGCRQGEDGIFRCDGQRLTLRFLTTAGIPSRQRTLEIVQRQLREVGVGVELVYVPVGPLFGPGGVLERGEFDAMLFSWVFERDPSGLVDVFGCEALLNFTGYCQRLVTADLDQADRILDARQRARVLNRAGRQIARDVPMIPLYQFVFTAGRSSRVRGFGLSPAQTLWNAEDWWLADSR